MLLHRGKIQVVLLMFYSIASLICSSAHAQLASLEYVLPQESQVDKFRLIFACGNLVRRLDGDDAGAKIHGYAVSRMASEKLRQEDGHQLIMEAGAFSKYVVTYYADDFSAVRASRTELCTQAKAMSPDLPYIEG